MAKASISIDDSFVLKFPKSKEENAYDEVTEEFVTTYDPYPACILEHFLNHPHRIELNHKGITGMNMDWEYQYNSDSDPFYLLEIQLEFIAKDGGKTGGYNWPLSVHVDKTQLSFADFNVLQDDGEFTYVSVHISAEISWDFKSKDLAKIMDYMNKNCGCPWEDVAMGLRFNFRDNYLWKKGDFLGYKSGMDVPKDEQTVENLPFILDRMPSVFCVLNHRLPDPEKEWEIGDKYWTKLEDKNVTFGGKYLSPFNP